MTAVELLPPSEAGPDNEKWHELRRTGITASEIACILGISPWQSPFGLYWSKVNGWRTDDNDIMSTGRLLEPAIADWWMASQDPLGNLVAARAGLYAHPARPWQLATPDRLLYLACVDCGGSGEAGGFLDPCEECDGSGIGILRVALLECKWLAYSWDGWGDPGTDQLPVHYRAQALWQLDVLGVDEVHIAALGPGGFRAYGPIVRDENDLDVMRKAGAEFARRLAEQDPPPLDGHSGTLATLKRLHPSVGEGAVEVDVVLSKGYELARAARKRAENDIAVCEAQIRAALGSTYARVTHDGKLVASRSVYDTERIDVVRLRAEQPDIAAAYTTTTTVDRLNPGRSESHD